jgi:hypothetical protein
MVFDQTKQTLPERACGVPNLTAGLVAVLQAKLELISALDIYKEDARQTDHAKALALFEHCQQTDSYVVQHLTTLLAEELGAHQPEADEETVLHKRPPRGGDLSSTRAEDQVDDASEDSFPASDPPSFSGTSLG